MPAWRMDGCAGGDRCLVPVQSGVHCAGVGCVQSNMLNYMPFLVCSPKGILLFYPVQSGSIWPNPAKRATKHVSKMKKSADLFRTFLS